MKFSAIKLGFNVKEIPITFKDRELGNSKMDISIFKEAFLGVIKLRFKKFEK
jgi:dolichol-phosphate mannosyltransferase